MIELLQKYFDTLGIEIKDLGEGEFEFSIKGDYEYGGTFDLKHHMILSIYETLPIILNNSPMTDNDRKLLEKIYKELESKIKRGEDIPSLHRNPIEIPKREENEHSKEKDEMLRKLFDK